MDPSDRKVRCLSRYLNQPIANLRIKFFVWYRAISQFQFSSFAFYTVKKKKKKKWKEHDQYPNIWIPMKITPDTSLTKFRFDLNLDYV